jgi:hypothetical protein
MQSRVMRLILAAVCCIVSGAAAIFLLASERQIAERRASVHAFDRRVREATEALADLRVAQQAYVAAGQGVAFWTAKVDATMSTLSNTLLTLRQSAPSRASNAALDEAGTTLGQLGTLDQRIRDYLRSGAPLMAADIIFAEGDETAADAARRLERARVEANLYLDGFEAARRKQEAQALAGSAGLVMLIVLGLALTPRKAVARMESPSLDQTGAPRDVTPLTMSPDETLPLRRAAWPEPESPGIARPVDVSKHAAASTLTAAAKLCTALGRVSDSQELRSLVGQVADMLDASGLVLWMATTAGDELRPAVAHGYDSQMVARIPAVPRSANNAAAAAYRTGTLQIVLSRPGSAPGAVVAPVLSADGCIGVLSAEIRDGGEASETVQALAAIMAAQLAGVLASTPATNEERATGSAAM